ncbi:MAG: hypothetical protein M3Z25_09980 [Actinomycetota bacterium]|nr:hypothetical protein [Actinomycetota bacterium]
MRDAGRVLLLAKQLSQQVLADGEAAEMVSGGGVELVGGGVQVRGRQVTVPGGAGGLQPGGAWPVPPAPGDPDPVVGDDAVVVLASGVGR